MGICGSLGPPRDIINITKSMYNHSLWIGPSKHNITGLIHKQLTHKRRMGTQMHGNYNNKRDNIKYGKDDNGNNLKLAQIQLIILQVNINEEDIVNNQSIHDQRKHTETVRYLLRILRPQLPRQWPRNGRHHQEDVNQAGHYCSGGHEFVRCVDLVDGHVQDEPVNGRGEVTGDEGQQGHEHWQVEGDVLAETVVMGLLGVVVVVVEHVQEGE